ncbi:MAG: ACT domain-containing protein [Syntrophaceticus sp.]|nr:ACT domain-containing protein [Syntrophaceticus sp.]MDD3314589.1 ACT domain-containing protein [Syntrophaceticus sp.]MDD4359765.1 ACT domain-containing protein [Syntrophaceticus sp.]MDD4782876.1 ACT domain-containing protein [Syntrophaceticus sp.]HBI27405.1 amino acid-binding protein [Peptococcaceae bacterium]
MPVKQITVFLENKCGRLANVAEVIGDEGINIRAFSVADTTDFGILRLIVSDPERTYEVLHRAQFAVRMTDVIAAQIPDHPGGLAQVLALMDEAGINIEYMYAFVAQVSGDALVVFRVENTKVAEQLMLGKGIKVLSGEEVYNI